MYQYSLQYYQDLFNLCLKNSEPCEDQAKRLEIIIRYSTENCYANICRGLFEKDKTLYSALLVFNILRHADKIPAKEWGLFVRGPGIVDRDTQPTNPKPEKIPEASWDLLCAAEFNLEEVVGEEVCAPRPRVSPFARRWRFLGIARLTGRRDLSATFTPSTRRQLDGVSTQLTGLSYTGRAVALRRRDAVHHEGLGFLVNMVRSAGPVRDAATRTVRRIDHKVLETHRHPSSER